MTIDAEVAEFLPACRPLAKDIIFSFPVYPFFQPLSTSRQTVQNPRGHLPEGGVYQVYETGGL